MTETVFRLKRHLTSFQIMILGFAGVILLGALVLMLPIATVQRVWTPFHEALFTSTSAVCVTGLVVQDTGSYWSAFGQTVILLLIQIGGLGVITGAVTFLMLSGRNITLKERSAMQDAISAPAVGGIVRLTRFILKGTFLVELLGALALLPAFCRDYGLRGVWMSVFHSVSAFCNAGFDILGRTDSLYPSLTAYAADPLVNIVIMLLIIVGGIGFLTWDDVCTHGLHLRRYRMQSKVILSATALLITIPAVLFYLTDFADLPVGERILASLFQSVTPRTAGYNTVDLTEMTDASQAVTILLMLTGGAPGSTAGGMKVTTLAVLIANAIAAFRRREDLQLFHRRLETSTVRNAAAIREYLPDRPLFVVTGSTVTFAKRRALREVLRDSRNGILLCTQQSLPSSVNFEFVNKIIIPEMHYNNAGMSQFYMRFVRYTSTEKKDLYFPIYIGSLESNLMQMVLAKEKLTMFMKGQDADMDEIYAKFGVDYDLLSTLMTRETDDEGHLRIHWGEQKIA